MQNQQPPFTPQQNSSKFPSPFSIPITTLNKRLFFVFLFEMILLFIVGIIYGYANIFAWIENFFLIAVALIIWQNWWAIYYVAFRFCWVVSSFIGGFCAGMMGGFTSEEEVLSAVFVIALIFFIPLMIGHIVIIQKMRKKYPIYEHMKKYAKKNNLSFEQVLTMMPNTMHHAQTTHHPFANMGQQAPQHMYTGQAPQQHPMHHTAQAPQQPTTQPENQQQ